jgi:hypothetical protein
MSLQSCLSSSYHQGEDLANSGVGYARFGTPESTWIMLCMALPARGTIGVLPWSQGPCPSSCQKSANSGELFQQLRSAIRLT